MGRGLLLRAAILGGLVLGASAAQASPIRVDFSGYGSYQTGSWSNSGHLYPTVYFVGTFRYDTGWLDSNPDPAVGQYGGSLVSSVGVTWWDGIVCNPFAGCPIGVNPGEWYGTLDPLDQHSVSLDDVGVIIRDGQPGGPPADVWGMPYRYANGPVEMSVEFALVDVFGASKQSHLSSDALGMPPTLAQFDFGSFINVSRREHPCNPSLDPTGPCGSLYSSELWWNGRFSTFAVVSEEAPAAVPEPASLGLLAFGLVGLVSRVRRRGGVLAASPSRGRVPPVA